jgi:putative hydrolase of the HAD superfamily
VPLRAVITDWGGVLTPPIPQLVRAWADADQINWEAYISVITPWLTAAYDGNGPPNPVHALERGECTPAEFERLLAQRLVRIDGGPVHADGLLTRMLAVGQPIEAMYDLIRGLRANGLRTALLSNSWGNDYLRDDWDQLFDAVVISGEVGMRKPDAEIYLHTLDRLGCAGPETVFVDDLEANVRGAAAVGIIGVHHRSYAETILELEVLFQLDLHAGEFLDAPPGRE